MEGRSLISNGHGNKREAILQLDVHSLSESLTIAVHGCRDHRGWYARSRILWMDTGGEDGGNSPKRHCHRRNNRQRQCYQDNGDSWGSCAPVRPLPQAIDPGMPCVFPTTSWHYYTRNHGMSTTVFYCVSTVQLTNSKVGLRNETQ